MNGDAIVVATVDRPIQSRFIQSLIEEVAGLLRVAQDYQNLRMPCEIAKVAPTDQLTISLENYRIMLLLSRITAHLSFRKMMLAAGPLHLGRKAELTSAASETDSSTTANARIEELSPALYALATKAEALNTRLCRVFGEFSMCACPTSTHLEQP